MCTYVLSKNPVTVFNIAISNTHYTASNRRMKMNIKIPTGKKLAVTCCKITYCPVIRLKEPTKKTSSMLVCTPLKFRNEDFAINNVLDVCMYVCMYVCVCIYVCV